LKNSFEGEIQPIILIITDFKMPKLNGLSMIKELKSFIRELNARKDEKIKIKKPSFVVTSAFLSEQTKKLF
jgi:CheY-like chemotaxis protein